MPSIELDGLEVNLYRSEEDGSLVVDISGPEVNDQDDSGAPKLRVWLNEGRLYENPLKGEPLTAVMVGNLTEGFRAVGPFEDFDEALKHCEAYGDPTWVVSLNSPHARPKSKELVG